MAVLFTDEELEQKYFGQTAFSISHRVLNPVTAIQEALKQHRNNHALEPPQNMSFQVIWFIQRNKLFPFRTFVIFNYPSPPELQTDHLWNMGFLEDSLDTAQGNHFELQVCLNLATLG